MSIPAGAINDNRTRVLLAVIEAGHVGGQDLAARLGRPVSSVWDDLRALRAEGLVVWDGPLKNTVRAAVGVVK